MINFNEKNERFFLLSIAKKEVDKQLKIETKKAYDTNKKVGEMSLTETTMKQRVQARMSADRAAEERNKWELRLALINKMIEEVWL